MFRGKTISACIINFNDYDILAEAIQSIANILDEIVIVDGAYAWCEPFLAGLGIDAARSNAESRRITDAISGIPVRTFEGVWKDEVEKRTFGYAQCKGDLIYLLDSDEVHVIDEQTLADFLDSKALVASVASPLFAWSDVVMMREGAPVEPGKPVLFKRQSIGAHDHLRYLWLVLTENERARVGEIRPSDLFTQLIGKNLHLSHLRTPATAINRARFYIMSHVRNTKKFPFFGGVIFDNADDLTKLFDFIPSAAFNDWLRGHYLTLGASPYNSYVYQDYLPPVEAQAAINAVGAKFRSAVKAEIARISREGVTLINGVEFFIDVSSDVFSAAGYRVAADTPIFNVSAQRYDFYRDAEGPIKTAAVARHQADGAWVIDHPSRPREEEPFRTLIGIAIRWTLADLQYLKADLQFV